MCIRDVRTELAYRAIYAPSHCYAATIKPGTDPAYAAIRGRDGWRTSSEARSCYAVSGTEAGYRATRLLRGV
eukprot:1976205-Rhodomonas_salina.2